MRSRTDETRRSGAGAAVLGVSRDARRLLALVVVSLASLLLAAPLAGQEAPAAERLADARWAPFVGCWEPAEPADRAAAGLLCVRPSGAGVEMFSIEGDEIGTSDLLVADGQPRPLRAEGCEGTEAVTFSEDGRRAFTTSRVVCDGVVQEGTGVLSVTSPEEWIDARSLEVDGERTAWVQRYRLATAERAREAGVPDPTFGAEAAARAARLVAHRGVGFAEVVEASRRIDPEALEVWLAARGQGFQPTADDLARLADAGVPDAVIDVVVAVSFPETFRVTPDGEAEAVPAERSASSAYRGAARPFYGGARSWFGYRMYGYGFHPADPLFYGYGYGYPGYWGYRPGVVIIERRDRDPVGRIIQGRGYTRGGSDGEGGRSAVPRNAPSGSGSERPSVAPNRRSGGEATSAPRSGSAPERRPARPRDPGR